MARSNPGVPLPPAPPDSPSESVESPPPTGVQGDLELELLGLANALYNLGTTVVNDLTKEKDKPGGGKQVGLRVWVLSALCSFWGRAVAFVPPICSLSFSITGMRSFLTWRLSMGCPAMSAL